MIYGFEFGSRHRGMDYGVLIRSKRMADNIRKSCEFSHVAENGKWYRDAGAGTYLLLDTPARRLSETLIESQLEAVK
jgi:hypothetical protein